MIVRNNSRTHRRPSMQEAVARMSTAVSSNACSRSNRWFPKCNAKDLQTQCDAQVSRGCREVSNGISVGGWLGAPKGIIIWGLLDGTLMRKWRWERVFLLSKESQLFVFEHKFVIRYKILRNQREFGFYEFRRGMISLRRTDKIVDFPETRQGYISPPDILICR